MQSKQRRLALEGAPNVRDLGGYQTAAGGITRWGRIFRAGRLSSLTPADQQVLSIYNIGTVCDFRRADEYQRDITSLGATSAANIHNLEISPGSQSGSLEEMEGRGAGQIDFAQWMVMVNRELALYHFDTFRQMFRLLLAEEQGAFLFHCSAGKDRTGFAAALILAALDVPYDTIMEDYLLTREYYPPPGELDYLVEKYVGAHSDVDTSVFEAMMDSRQEYLDAALNAVESEYGGMDNYLSGPIGLTEQDRKILIERYVELNP